MGTIQLNTREMIEHMNQDYRTSMVSGDLKGLVDRFYAKDARVQPNHQPEAVGHAAILKTYEGMSAQYGMKDLAQEITSVDSEGDVVWATGTYKLDFQPEGAAELQHDAGKYIEVFRRQSDGSFRCILDAFNSDLPMPA